MIRQFINNFGRITYRVKRFSQLVREDFKEVFFSERQDDIEEWVKKSEALGYEILKIMEFYDCDGNDFKHWIDSASDKLFLSKSNQFVTPLSLGFYIEDLSRLIVDEDIKNRIKNSLHGKNLIDSIWKRKILNNLNYRDLVKVNNFKRIYDDEFYVNLFSDLILVFNDSDYLNNIDTNSLFKKKSDKLEIKQDKTRPKSRRSFNEIKLILKEFIFRIKGYEI